MPPLDARWYVAVTAVDTNVLVRFLTGDDPKQTAAPKALFEGGPIWIAKTVLLETRCVLSSLYGFEDQAIADALIKLLGLEMFMPRMSQPCPLRSRRPPAESIWPTPCI